MKIYEGTTNAGRDAVVLVDGKPLDPRLHLRNHSPTGFAWGYAGSGPAQLALALCSDALGDDRRALAIYQHYKAAHVSKWKDGWRVTDEQIKLDVAALEG